MFIALVSCYCVLKLTDSRVELQFSNLSPVLHYQSACGQVTSSLYFSVLICTVGLIEQNQPY